MLIISSFPYKIGYDCAGVVEEIGSSVSHLKVGDEVYTRLPEASRGLCFLILCCFWLELTCVIRLMQRIREMSGKIYCSEAPFSFISRCCLYPLAAMTALQALRRYNGDLAGKTVLVPAGCMLANSSGRCISLTI